MLSKSFCDNPALLAKAMPSANPASDTALIEFIIKFVLVAFPNSPRFIKILVINHI